MRVDPGQENLGQRRTGHPPFDLEADWSYLRANLDHPAHRMGSRLGSGLAAWLLRRLHASDARPPQLSILARIALGPRQSLALVEAEGVHVLVGTSTDGPPSFFSLHGACACNAGRLPNREAPPIREAPPVREALTNGQQPHRRATPNTGPLGWHPGLQRGSLSGARPLSSPRLTSRVSWV